MDRAFIYLLHHAEDSYIYIGKSERPKQRWRQHLTPSSLKTNTPKNDWIKALQRRGAKPELLILENTENWEEAERFYISYFRAIGASVLNYTDGGDGVSGVPQETRAKISAAHKGKSISKEHRYKISQALQGRKKPPFTETHKNNIKNAQRKRIRGPLSAAHCAAISKGKRGSVATKTHRAKLRIAWVTRRVRGVSQETRAKISAALKGRSFSAAHRNKLSHAARERKYSPLSTEHKHRISNALRGKPKTEEHRKKLSTAWVSRKKRAK